MVRSARSTVRTPVKTQRVPSTPVQLHSSKSGSNSDMRFSICVPTRGRPENVKRLIDSIYSTASKPSTVEIIFRTDNDDKGARRTKSAITENIKKLKEENRVHIKMAVGERLQYLSDLWEDCYSHAISDRIMMCADDVIFRTQGWDNTIANGTPNADKNIYFIWGNDLNQRRGLATLPMMSRLWIETVGYFVPKGYACDWCDTHIHDIANRLANLGSDIRCYFGDVVFEHMHPSVGKAKWDDTYGFRRSKVEQSQYYKRTGERQTIAQKIHDTITARGLAIINR